MPVSDLIEELQDAAQDMADDLEGFPAHETFEGQAAQVLEEFEQALTEIAAGVASPQAVARAALSLAQPLKPIGSAEDTVRHLLKPRSY